MRASVIAALARSGRGARVSGSANSMPTIRPRPRPRPRAGCRQLLTQAVEQAVAEGFRAGGQALVLEHVEGRERGRA